MALTPDEVQRHVNDARGAVAELRKLTTRELPDGMAEGDSRFSTIEKIGLSLAQAIEALAREVRQ